jgi:hypothetical protein
LERTPVSREVEEFEMKNRLVRLERLGELRDLGQLTWLDHLELLGPREKSRPEL